LTHKWSPFMHVMLLLWSMPLLYLLPTNTLLKPAMSSYIASYTGQHTHCACGTLLDIYIDHFFSCQWYHPKQLFTQPHGHMYMVCPYAISDKIGTASCTYVHVLSLCGWSLPLYQLLKEYKWELSKDTFLVQFFSQLYT
jgi:hypothetical protein